MKTTWPLLVAGGLSGLALTARAADMRPMTLVDLAGQLHIYQPLPGTCDTVDQTVPAIAGALEIAPGEDAVWDGPDRVFQLQAGRLAFAPFTVERHCMLQDVVRQYTSVVVTLSRAVTFRAAPGAPFVYAVTIPKEEVLLRQALVVNGGLESGDLHPMEDVTGTIDLGLQRVTMQVKVRSEVRGNEGTLTATLTARIVGADYDGDGQPNNRDNCRLVPNPSQQPIASPVILAPPDRTYFSCVYRELQIPAAADVCRGLPLTVAHNAPPKLPKGPSLVTWTATDSQGHTASAVQRVTIDDRVGPTFQTVPPDVSLTNCGPASLGLPTAYDDCDATVAFTNDAPAVFPRGTTQVHWRATDSSGNQQTASTAQLVSVTDLVKPNVSCTARPDPEDRRGVLFQVAGTDACGLLRLTLGAYLLENGELVKLTPSTISGVLWLNEGEHAVKHFRVGPNANVIRATDGSGNFRTAICTVPTSPFPGF